MELVKRMDIGNIGPEYQQLLTLIEKYKDSFSKSDEDIGYCDLVKHRIITTDDVPVKLPHRRVPPHQWPEVRESLKRMLDTGIIRPSSSPYAAAVVVVRKSSGKLRICLDYRQLNLKTHKDAYPLPRIDEALEALKGAKYFSSIDLAHGCHQVAIEDKDIEKTAFRVGTGGLFEFTRMPMGLCNSPATFMRLMDLGFRDLNFQSILIYLDDILLFGSSPEELLKRTDIVLSILASMNLKIQPEKCHWFQEQLHYLGHLISSKGVLPDPGKVSSVKNWAIPTNEKNLRSYLGLVGYYRKHIKSFAAIAQPLYDILDQPQKKRRSKVKPATIVKKFSGPFPERWSPECEASFLKLKECLITAPLLGFPDFKCPFILETDASFHGVGAVLSQVQECGLVVLGYASRALRKTERVMQNYSAMKLELLALKWSISEKFRDLLLGATFTVYTDNNPLCYLQSTAKLGAIETRWAADLSMFNFEVKYSPGRENRNADSLSRKPEIGDGTETVSMETINSVHIDENFNTQSTILSTDLRNHILDLLVGVSADAIQAKFEISPSGLPVTPKPKLIQLQQEDEAIGRFLTLWNQGHPPTRRQAKRETVVVRRLLRDWKRFQIIDGLLYRCRKGNGVDVQQLLLPKLMHEDILHHLHDQMGHQGAEKTLLLIQARSFWPFMSKDVERYCQQCERCLLAKSGKKIHPSMGNLLAKKPLEVLAIDFTLLEPASNGMENVLIITDAFTKYTMAIPTRDQKAVTVAKTLVKEW